MSASGIDIGSPTEAELQDLFSLAKGAFADRPGWSDEHVLDALLHDVVFIAHEESLPAGYVALRPELQEAVVVEQVLVAPGHEDHGVGERLLAHAEGYAIAEGARSLRVICEEDNWRARSFYRQLGYSPVEQELFELVLPFSA
jgi:ribosomal protein S18 acetylase RimI-like enzyme